MIKKLINEEFHDVLQKLMKERNELIITETIALNAMHKAWQMGFILGASKPKNKKNADE